MRPQSAAVKWKSNFLKARLPRFLAAALVVSGWPTILESGRKRLTACSLWDPSRFVKVLDERSYGAIHPLHLFVPGLDHIVFIRGMGSTAMTESEMTCREVQWFVRKDISGPGTGTPRQHKGINTAAHVHSNL